MVASIYRAVNFKSSRLTRIGAGTAEHWKRRKRKHKKMPEQTPDASHKTVSATESAPRNWPLRTGVGTVIRFLILNCLLLAMREKFAHLPQVASVAEATTLTDYDGATFYKATVGSRVRIACNGSHWSDDSVSLLLWFKGSNSVPIYTVDARQRSLNSGARHFVSDAYKGRAKFNTRATPPYLDLSPLEAGDQAEYRCRVDYRSQPRENFLVILFVLVPPKSVQVMDSNGRSLEQIYGPLSEGSDLTLLCLSKGGRPPPAITWRQRNKVIDDSYLTLNDFLALQQAGRLFPQLDNSSLAGYKQSYNSNSIVATTPSDNNRRRPDGAQPVGAQNLMNLGAADPSYSMNMLESLYLDWRQWPEYDFFLHEQNNNYTSQRQLPSDSSTGIKMAPHLAEPEAAATGSGANYLPANGSSQLLELTVHESITTSANVLRLQSLGSPRTTIGTATSTGAGGSANDESENNSGAGDNGISLATNLSPQLECQASNLHYDLRTLIKLFAPASLAGAAHPDSARAITRGPPTLVPESQVGGPPPGPLDVEAQFSRQLVEAIDRARESALASSSDWPATEESHEPSPAWSGGRTKVAESRGQAGNDLTAAGGGDKWDNTTGNKLSLVAGSWDAAGVIYQQLARPHQLSSSTINGSGAVATNSGNNNNTNNDQPQPALIRSKLIALHIYLRPLDVQITTPPRPQAAGQVSEFSCTSTGSRPPAKLIWFMNGRQLDSKLWRQVEEPSGNASHSKLSLQLERQDHGAQLVCRAENQKLAELMASEQAAADSNHSTGSIPSAIEDSRILTVHYPPKLRLELGNKVLSSSIKEFSDIYFVCQVDANPPVREITWLHNERPLNESSSPRWRPARTNPSHLVEEAGDTFERAGSEQDIANVGPLMASANLPPHLASTSSAQLGRSHDQYRNTGSLIISNNSLVLQRVRREQRGHYACAASNSEGISESNRIELRVLHAPICRHPSGADIASQQQPPDSSILVLGSWSLSLHSRARFLCQMEAEPPDVEVSWYLNSTRNERRLLFSGQVSLPAGDSAAVEPNRNKKDRMSADEGRKSDQSSARTFSEPTGARLAKESGHNNGNYNNNNNNNLEGDTNRKLASNSGRAQPSSGSGGLVTSQLEYLVDTSLDYGQLYCVARNAIGEQKRACVYHIQAPDPFELQPDIAAKPLTCIAASVTASSVSLACDHPGATIHFYSVAIYKSSARADSSSLDTAEVKFNDAALLSDGGEGGGGHIEPPNLPLVATLQSGQLDEPLFSIAHLQPATNYELHVQSMDIAAMRPAIVRFATGEPEYGTNDNLQDSANNNRRFLPGEERGTARDKPSIVPISEQQQQRNLMAALISTRSTSLAASQDTRLASNSEQLTSESVARSQHSSRWPPQKHQPQQPPMPPSSLLDRIWSSLGGLFQVGAGPSRAVELAAKSTSHGAASSYKERSRMKAGNASQAAAAIATNNQLMDLSDTFFITSVCLGLLVSLSLLLVLSRHSKLSIWIGFRSSGGPFGGQRELEAPTSGGHSPLSLSSVAASISPGDHKNSKFADHMGIQMRAEGLNQHKQKYQRPRSSQSEDDSAKNNLDRVVDSANANTTNTTTSGLGSGSDSGLTTNTMSTGGGNIPPFIQTNNNGRQRYSSSTLGAKMMNQKQQQQRRMTSVMLPDVGDTTGCFGAGIGRSTATTTATISQQNPIRVSRSRSSASVCRLDLQCPSSVGYGTATKQKRPRFLHMNDADRRLISDANLSISGGGGNDIELELHQNNANPMGAFLANSTATTMLAYQQSGQQLDFGTIMTPDTNCYTTGQCNGTTSACLIAGSKKQQQQQHYATIAATDSQQQFCDQALLGCLFVSGSRPQSSSLISDESSQTLSVNHTQRGLGLDHQFIELIPAIGDSHVNDNNAAYTDSSALLGQIISAGAANQREFTLSDANSNGHTTMGHHFHLHPTSLTSSCSLGSPPTTTTTAAPSTMTVHHKDRESNLPPYFSNNVAL